MKLINKFGPQPNHWLLSLHPHWWWKILEGQKRCELRRRPMRQMEQGDIIWVYVTKAKMLVGNMELMGRPEDMTEPDLEHGPELSEHLARSEWFTGMDYFQYKEMFRDIECPYAYAVSLPKVLHPSIPLAELRAIQPGFHPPQQYTRLPDSIREAVKLEGGQWIWEK